MSVKNTPAPESLVDPVNFVATDVTGLRRLDFEGIDGHRTASEVATSVASAMDLPTNVPWALRHDERARMLEQDAALGGQVEVGDELVVIPQSHLG